MPKPVIVDVSHFQPNIDFAAVKAFGIRGVIIKSSQSVNGVDPSHAAHVLAARAAGLLVGHYHFFETGSPEPQMQHFLDTAKPEPGDLMAIDHERLPPRSGSTRATLAELHQACEFIAGKLNRKAVIYSGNDLKEQLGNYKDAFLGAHRLWLASYTTHPVVQPSWPKYWAWQYTGDGAGQPPHDVPGIGAKIDISTYDGTDEQLAAEWAA